MIAVARVAALIVLASATIAVAAEPGPTRVRVAATIPAPAFDGDSTQIPMPVEDAKPIVEAKLNGKGPYRFLIDTGAMGHLVIDTRIVEDLSLTPSGRALAGDPSGKNPVEISLYEVAELQLGEVTFKNLRASDRPASMKRPGNFDGILGLALFQSHTLTLEYAKGQLGLSIEALPEGADTAASSQDRALTIPIRVGDHQLNVHLDTGNSRGALMLTEADARAMAPNATPVAAGQAHTISNTVDLFTLAIDVPVHFGPTKLPITQLTYPSVVETGNLGSPGLTGMIVRIDQKNRRVQIAAH